VAFDQLYYTSCEHGVGGYAGFQFNALSQGVGARVMREVEQLTAYELPSWDTSPADAPVNLCHIRDAARGGDITANVVYAGADFSGRSGNYFAHALVTENPERDFGGLLPVELWESSVWVRTPADSTALPALQATPPRGSFDRPTVAAFLATQDDAQPVLARLLSAVDQALDGGRSLVLWSPTSADNAHWIAAVSYLLGDARAREMSFFTYTRRPAQCRAHVIGTVPGAVTSAVALADGFRVFDMAARTLPDVPTHPLAALLAQVGVLRAAGLWRQATTLAGGTERSLDDWHPVVSAAAALLGIEPLPSAAVGVIADWLAQAAHRPAPLTAPHVEAVLTVLLDRDRELSDDQLRPLLPLAKAAGAVGHLQRIEVILVDRAVAQLARGRPPPGPTPVATAEGIQLAVTNCERLLGSADAAAAMTVLDWARETGLRPDPPLVEQCARDVIGPALPTMNADRRIVRVGQAYPALARGLAAFITASGSETALTLLRGAAGELLDASDLRNHPELREMLLQEDVRSGRVPPIQALRELIELRPPSASPLRDRNLLVSIWPRGPSRPARRPPSTGPCHDRHGRAQARPPTGFSVVVACGWPAPRHVDQQRAVPPLRGGT
jgi:GTPase-associated protein 1, N-terminal domain type 2/GTPase-associated protein 1, middle domain/GTPase-associated protein 1, C-terminal domain